MDTTDKSIIPPDMAKAMADKLIANGVKPKRVSKLDQLNEKLAAEAYDNKNETHVRTLHPTKGWRRVSIKRLIQAGDIHHRFNIFWTTIAKAAKAKHEKDLENGKAETTAS